MVVFLTWTWQEVPEDAEANVKASKTVAGRAAFGEVRFRLDDERVAPNNQNVVMCPSTVISPSDVISHPPELIFLVDNVVPFNTWSYNKNIHM